MRKKELIPIDILVSAYKIIEDLSNWDNNTKYYHLSDEWVLKFRPYRSIAILQKYPQKSLKNMIFEVIIYQKIKNDGIQFSSIESNEGE